MKIKARIGGFKKHVDVLAWLEKNNIDISKVPCGYDEKTKTHFIEIDEFINLS